MKIIIAGDGETGTHLACMLSVENQDVVLMGADPQRLHELEAKYNFITFAGCATSPADLMECGAGEADLFVAVTSDENANLVACQLAKGAGASRCVARVDNPEYADGPTADILRRAGVDLTINPEKLAADSILQFISHNWTNEWYHLNRGELLLVGVRVGATDIVAGKSLRELGAPPRFFHVAAIKRGGDVLIPRGDDVVCGDDTLYISTLPHYAARLHALCGKSSIRPKKIMVTGAGRVSENLIRGLDSDISVTLVDADRARCRELAYMFPHVVVVNARSNDVGVLREEGLNECDMLLALTGSSETNIVSCMVARQHGVSKTLARVEEFQYMQEAESLEIDKVVNKKQLNAGVIMNELLNSDMASTQCVASDSAEVSMIRANAGSRIVSAPISELRLPPELTIAGLVRDGRGELVEGSTRIYPGDQVVLFFLSGALPKVKRLFS